MGTLQANIGRRQRHIAQTADCFRAFAEPLRLTLTTEFSCNKEIAQEIVEETFLLMYEQLEAGADIACPPVWLYVTSARLMRRRRTVLVRVAWRIAQRLQGVGCVGASGLARLRGLARRLRRQPGQDGSHGGTVLGR